MSKMAAIDYAVCTQLRDLRPDAGINYRAAMNAAPNNFDTNSLQTFLINVGMRLKLDTPSCTFNWNALNLDICLNSTLTILESHIAMNTTVDPAK
jgi:hypothetical protein